jgi:polar amino acid transport system substrate-binding protein
MLKALLWLGWLAMLVAGAHAAPASPEAAKELAPTGRLRAAINFGNPVLAQRDGTSGEPRGVSVDLARELGRRLGIAVDLVPFEAAGKVFEAAQGGAWDIAFLAIDPVRAGEIAFTPPYVVIEGTYLVPKDSGLRAIEDVDRDGVRITVGKGSAYDLYLTRAITKAQLVRAPTSQAALELFRNDKIEAAAGVKQALVAFSKADPSFRVMDGRFMAIEQAMGTPKGRDKAVAYLGDFIEEMKASGFVAEALARSNQPEAVVAPPARRP